MTIRFLSASDIRTLSERFDVHPTKTLGQNFVVDSGTVSRIVRAGGVRAGDTVMEIGPGLGSLTLGLLDAGARVLAVEIDTKLSAALPETAAEYAPDVAGNLQVINMDAMDVAPADLAGAADPATRSAPVSRAEPPTRLVANLPYNVAVPVILHCLATFPTIESVLVMVQSEVAERIVAGPGSRVYGIPSAKVAWYASAERAGAISRGVFWPVPRVDSALVRLERRKKPLTNASREQVFAVIDAAFSQRRKTLRSALAQWAGSATNAETILAAAGIDHTRRGETLTIEEFATIAACAPLAPGAAAKRRRT